MKQRGGGRDVSNSASVPPLVARLGCTVPREVIQSKIGVHRETNLATTGFPPLLYFTPALPFGDLQVFAAILSIAGHNKAKSYTCDKNARVKSGLCHNDLYEGPASQLKEPSYEH